MTLSLVAPDCDGLPMVSDHPISISGQENTASLTTRIGRVAPLLFRLTDGERLLDEQAVAASKDRGSDSRALASTDTLVVRIGDKSDTIAGAAEEAAVMAAVALPSHLPTEWVGYEAVDLLVIESRAAEAWRESPPSAEQIAALLRWVESGGRVLLSLGDDAGALIGEGSPLADISPGRFRRVITLPSATPLDSYADAEESLAGQLRVAQLEAVEGVIEAHGPGRPSDLPLIIQTARGLGEVLTLTFDIDSTELAAWPGRERLLLRLFGDEGDSVGGAADAGGRIRRSSNELASVMRSRLGSNLAGVAVTPFMAIVAATLIYLTLIGPGDYFFVKRILKRMSLTWLTFSLLVATACAAVVGFGAVQQGDAVVVNQIELVDVDVSTGAARGALWAEVYSARGERRSLSIAPQTPNGAAIADADAWLGWFGSPGAGLTGMQVTRSGSSLRSAYQLGPADGQLTGLPINPASTKSLAARWVTHLSDAVETDLTANRSGLVDGTVVNETGASLRNARLLYGEWAWRLGTLADGQAALVDEGLAPVKITTLLRSDVAGKARGRTVQPIDVDDLDAAGLLKLMMFYRQAGGESFAERDHRYQRFIDLSHQIRAGRAILLAEVDGPVSRLMDADTDRPLVADEGPSGVYYRFVLPVAPAE